MSGKDGSKLGQGWLYLIIGGFILVVVILTVCLSPDVGYAAGQLWEGIVWFFTKVFKILSFIIAWILVLFGPIILGLLFASVVNQLDDRFGEYESIPTWGYWVISLLTGLIVLYFWMLAPAWIVSLPSWIKDWEWFGLPGPHDYLQWGWGIWGALSWFITVNIKFSMYRSGS